jgi:hypothetical protein
VLHDFLDFACESEVLLLDVQSAKAKGNKDRCGARANSKNNYQFSPRVLAGPERTVRTGADVVRDLAALNRHG